MNDLLDDFFKEFSKHMDRGDYYQKQGNYRQSLKEYSKAFGWLYQALVTNENRSKPSSYADPIYLIKTKINALFTLIGISRNLVNCYIPEKEYFKANALMKYLKEFVASLNQYTSDLEVKQIQQYEAYLKSIELLEATIQLGMTEEMEEKSKLVDEADEELFRSLLKDLTSICSLKISSSDSKLSELEVDTGRGACFIATAAYSTENHSDLKTFREFRDTKLLTSEFGKWLIVLYYRIGPWLAGYIMANPTLKKFLRHKLEALAQWMRDKEITSK